MIADLMARLRAGKITARNLESQQRSLFRKNASAVERIAKALGSTGKLGRQHAADELARFDAEFGGAR